MSSTKPKFLKGLKPGDEVFIAHQKQRGATERRTQTSRVTRVGRKYAYIQLNRYQEAPFHRDSGLSAHDRDTNARENGHGFDVYLCVEDYRRDEFNKAEKARLQKRIVDHWGRLVNLSPDAIDKIHDVLDSEGVDTFQ